MLTDNLLPEEAKRKGFFLPRGYHRVFELGLTNIEPWYFVTSEEFELLLSGINSRYENRFVIPFARRKDCDDIGCFVVASDHHKLGNVLVIHDYASPGGEVGANLDNFWDWFKLAINEMIEWSESV